MLPTSYVHNSCTCSVQFACLTVAVDWLESRNNMCFSMEDWKLQRQACVFGATVVTHVGVAIE